MKFTEVAIYSFISIFSFILACLHLFRKKYAINRVYSFANLLGMILFGLCAITTLFDSLRDSQIIKLLLMVLGIMITVLTFHVAMKYPRWERPLPKAFTFASIVCAVFVSCIISFKSYIAPLLGEQEIAKQIFDKLYEATIALFLFASIVVLFYRTKSLINISFRRQMILLAWGYIFLACILVIGVYIEPRYSYGLNVIPFGSSVSFFFWTIIVNHALLHEKDLDLGAFYREIIFWLFFFGILSIPSYVIFKFGRTEIAGGNPIPIEGIAIIIFLYLFLTFRFIKPLFYRMITKINTDFETQANEFLKKIALISSEEKGEAYWDVLLENAILPLESIFSIQSATLFIKTSGKKFELGYSFGKKLTLGDIEPGNEVYACFNEYRKLLHVSYFYIDSALEKFNVIKERMESAGVVAILPFYDHNSELMGILLLGEYQGNVYYPNEVLNFLETFRIQFELSLANALMLEQVKNEQRTEHESLIVHSIKKRIFPAELPTIPGIRVSCFHFDGSNLGGDYLDTVVVGKNGLGMFMCDASDAGMESGVLLLEIYSILHNQPEKWEMPDKMLNAMNWVVATSRYTHRYVPAVYCLYRNIERQLLIAGAAFNPLTLYVLSKDEFIVYDVKGVPLGVEKNYNYDVNAINISEIVIGFIYSDGIVSAVNRNGNPYSIGRIKDIIRLNKEDTPALLARKIYMDFTSFMEGVDLQTDASLLIFKIAQREF